MRFNARFGMAVSVVAGVCLVGGSLTGFVSADASEVNAADATAAIQAVAPEAVGSVARMTSDADTAAQATVNGAQVSVPVDATDGISLGASPNSVRISLPFASQASDAADSPVSGVPVYNNNNGSSTVPVIHRDGTVQINTVIDNAGAPKRYDYPIDVPSNASLVQSSDGTVAVVTNEGVPLTVFGDAWAKDANGNDVPTHYEVHGNTLTQVVEHDERTAYPVVADPTTGSYSYNCVGINGSSYFMAPGSKLTNCKGSYLQKYLDGRMIKSVSLVYGGRYSVRVTGRGGCLVTVGGVASLVFFPPTSGWGWFAAASLAAASIASSCTGF